jgi:UDP-glucose 4-epimerase
MSTVAVTGASGYLGRALLEQLGNDATVTRVVGIDIAEPSFTTRNLEFYKMDVRSPQLVDALRGCDAVVHLAAVDATDPDETRDVNIGGTRSVADAAARAEVRKIIFASTGRVYGAHADNDYPLTEDSPIRPGRDDAYAVSKAEAESVLHYFADAHPDRVVTILRFAWMCGPSLPTRHAFVVDAKLRVVIANYEPSFQAVHESDATHAVAFVVGEDQPGTFNVCAADAIDRPEEFFGQRRVTLRLESARRVLARTARLGLSVPPTHIGALMYPQVMSNEALVTRGFAFEHTTAEALAQAAEARREWVALGRLHFRPRRMAMVGGTLGAVLLGTAVNKRREARRETSRGTVPSN